MLRMTIACVYGLIKNTSRQKSYHTNRCELISHCVILCIEFRETCSIMSRNNFSTFIFLLASIATPTVHADGFSQLGLSVLSGSKTCILKEYGPDSPKSYQGKRKFDICMVEIPAKEFNKEYEFCSLSGISTLHVNELDGFICKVTYQEDGWKFTAVLDNLSSAGKKKEYHHSIDCTFICKNKR